MFISSSTAHRIFNVSSSVSGTASQRSWNCDSTILHANPSSAAQIIELTVYSPNLSYGTERYRIALMRPSFSNLYACRYWYEHGENLNEGVEDSGSGRLELRRGQLEDQAATPVQCGSRPGFRRKCRATCQCELCPISRMTQTEPPLLTLQRLPCALRAPYTRVSNGGMVLWPFRRSCC
ncbi:hypothetical protein GALMADRAFT_1124468 [Galerina marginata CBS 339.88]|uniref:Uncharacterized protein n=1 Tax=Galerina marginata (strain CBS 339.88) TaxID=685588 RepID=A0A067TDI8_GALM3|nr:hypothetical protein GALMADRAFT_1124468 [Galerina marginata CBS 339.88]